MRRAHSAPLIFENIQSRLAQESRPIFDEELERQAVESVSA